MRLQLARSLMMVTLTAAGAQTCDVAYATDQPKLVSITEVALGNMQFVDSISLQLHNLRVVAVCHVPFDWHMQVGMANGLTTVVDGEAGHGASALGSDYLDELRNLLLVTASSPDIKFDDAREYKIEGSLIIDVRGEDPGLEKVMLEPANLVVEPADRCPPPRR